MDRLLGIWAHPDDEAYLSAGLMGRVADAGGQVVCVHATDGELGVDDPSLSRDQVAALRRRELAASLAVVSVTDSRRLGLPDGELAHRDPTGPVNSLTALILAVDPDAIVTFGPGGMTGHPDHRTVSRWATAAWRASGHRGDLLYATTSSVDAERRAALYREHAILVEGDGPERSDPADVAVELALTEWELERKRRALAAHASQTDRLAAALGERRFRLLWERELFRRPTEAERAAYGTAA